MEKIKKLKQIFKSKQIDGYLIPKNDEFFGEDTPKQNDRLNYISNFSGSFGYALILKDKNYLFVDGRYSLQARSQSGKFFKIVTMPDKMPYNVLKRRKLIIGIDPKLFTKKHLNLFFGKSNCKYKLINPNLIDKIWKRKTEKKINNFYILPKQANNKSYKLKVKEVVSFLKEENADFQFITACENCAWLLNIRGRDAKFSPIPKCYILIDKYKNIQLFCDLKKISPAFKKKFYGVKFVDIKILSKILLSIKNQKLIIDRNTCSLHFDRLISEKNKVLEVQDPIYNFKSIKSREEIKNIVKAHVYDGIALTKYLFWLKKNFNKKKITEITGSEKLFKFRKENKKFKFLSFPTISGAGPNGAIIHYRATKKTNRKLKKGDIYLVDSGGQYEFGTTDVTRTISLGNSNKRIKNIFTRVLKGHIAVSDFNLKKNTISANIDKKARKFLKQIGLNYMHGTGHGVGYFLNVHEGPIAISIKNKFKFKEGMVLSNEPGYYEKNKFGIRIENLIYVKKQKNKIFFENFTKVPIDKDLIEEKMLNKREKEWINNYHRNVFKSINNKMNKNESLELKKACSAI